MDQLSDIENVQFFSLVLSLAASAVFGFFASLFTDVFLRSWPVYPILKHFRLTRKHVLGNYQNILLVAGFFSGIVVLSLLIFLLIKKGVLDFGIY